jgi:putative molybdopterin biosynthesis protein
LEETLNDESSYTPEDVAKILKISRFTVYELIKRGELAAYHIGRKVRVEPADLERYKQNAKGCPPPLTQSTVKTAQSLSNLDQGLIICGQDIVLDVLARHLQTQLPHLRFLRQYIGSIPGLLALYQGTANLVTAHLWDGDSGEYNLPFVRRLLPGQRTLIYNLVHRYEGFYVAKGNPKSLQTWNDLTKPGVRFVNRECGAGARVLLDEQLHKSHIESTSLLGYGHEETSHLAVASCVARGEADVGLGTEKAALQVEGIEFIPLQKERYDLVMRKEDLNKPHFQTLIAILQSPGFRNEVSGMGGYDISDMGRLMAEF